MKKAVKRIGIGLGCMVIIFGVVIVIALQVMGKKTKEALAKQENAVIDMKQVADGSYLGKSDGGMVKVEVEVIVKDHTIQSINLIKHENGKGKPAEATLDEMVKQNTDDVDVVSGATISSKTIRNAVNKALQKGVN